jgi:hypothetical protein
MPPVAANCGHAGAVGHGVKPRQLRLVQRMVGLVGAGQMAHQEFRAGIDTGSARPPAIPASRRPAGSCRCPAARPNGWPGSASRCRVICSRLFSIGVRSRSPIISVSPAMWPDRMLICGPGPSACRTAAPSSAAATKKRRAPARPAHAPRGHAKAIGIGLDHGGGLHARGGLSRSSARQLAAMASRSMVRVAVAMRLFSAGAGRGSSGKPPRPAAALALSARSANWGDRRAHEPPIARAPPDEDAGLYLTRPVLDRAGAGHAAGAFVQPLPTGPGLGGAGAGLSGRRPAAAAVGAGANCGMTGGWTSTF